MAAELKVVEPQQNVTLIHSREKLLSSEPLPDDFKDRTLLLLKEASVEVLMDHRVTKVTLVETSDGSPLFRLSLGDESELMTSHVIWALSKGVPSTSYLPDFALDPEGYVKIGPTYALPDFFCDMVTNLLSLNFTDNTPNSMQHFAVGDIAAWSGIKRCGAAMYMGHNAAVNIHQQLLQKHFTKVPKFIEISEVPPMIALAVGKKAVLYGPEDGTTWGEDKMEAMFGNDLGYTSKYLVRYPG
jgi:NADH dehydrogenase FAD-containing subunit